MCGSGGVGEGVDGGGGVWGCGGRERGVPQSAAGHDVTNWGLCLSKERGGSEAEELTCGH